MDRMLQILKNALALELEARPEEISDSEDQIEEIKIERNPT